MRAVRLARARRQLASSDGRQGGSSRGGAGRHRTYPIAAVCALVALNTAPDALGASRDGISLAHTLAMSIIKLAILGLATYGAMDLYRRYTSGQLTGADLSRLGVHRRPAGASVDQAHA